MSDFKEINTTTSLVGVLRKQFEERSLDYRFQKVQSLKDLFLAQLQDNLNSNDLFDYLRVDSTSGETRYSLPCEFWEFDNEPFLSIPQTSIWNYKRFPPKSGEHSLLSEMDSDNYHFSRPFREITGKEVLEVVSKQEPLIIGDRNDANQTPYHMFHLDEDGIEIELLCHPTLAQMEKLKRLKDNISESIPLRFSVKNVGKIDIERDPLEEDINLDVYSSVITEVGDRAFGVDLVDNQLTIISRPFEAGERRFLYGFGVVDGQLDTVEETSRNPVVFYFEPNAGNHSEAKAGFVLDTIDYAIKLNKDEKTVLNNVWKYRSEIVSRHCPFTLFMGGYEIPCGFRAMVDIEQKKIVVEILADKETLENSKIKKILEGVGSKATRKLRDLVQPIGSRLGKELLSENFTCEYGVIPVTEISDR